MLSLSILPSKSPQAARALGQEVLVVDRDAALDIGEGMLDSPRRGCDVVAVDSKEVTAFVEIPVGDAAGAAREPFASNEAWVCVRYSFRHYTSIYFNMNMYVPCGIASLVEANEGEMQIFDPLFRLPFVGSHLR